MARALSVRQRRELRAMVHQLSTRELRALNYLGRLYLRRKADPNPETVTEIVRMEVGLRAYIEDYDMQLPDVPVMGIRH